MAVLAILFAWEKHITPDPVRAASPRRRNKAETPSLTKGISPSVQPTLTMPSDTAITHWLCFAPLNANNGTSTKKEEEGFKARMPLLSRHQSSHHNGIPDSPCILNANKPRVIPVALIQISHGDFPKTSQHWHHCSTVQEAKVLMWHHDDTHPTITGHTFGATDPTISWRPIPLQRITWSHITREGQHGC